MAQKLTIRSVEGVVGPGVRIEEAVAVIGGSMGLLLATAGLAAAVLTVLILSRSIPVMIVGGLVMFALQVYSFSKIRHVVIANSADTVYICKGSPLQVRAKELLDQTPRPVEVERSSWLIHEKVVLQGETYSLAWSKKRAFNHVIGADLTAMR